MWKAPSSPFHKVTGTQRTVQTKISGLVLPWQYNTQCQHWLFISIQSLTNWEIFDTLPRELSQQPFRAEFAGPWPPCY